LTDPCASGESVRSYEPRQTAAVSRAAAWFRWQQVRIERWSKTAASAEPGPAAEIGDESFISFLLPESRSFPIALSRIAPVTIIGPRPRASRELPPHRPRPIPSNSASSPDRRPHFQNRSKAQGFGLRQFMKSPTKQVGDERLSFFRPTAPRTGPYQVMGARSERVQKWARRGDRRGGPAAGIHRPVLRAGPMARPPFRSSDDIEQVVVCSASREVFPAAPPA